MRGRLWRKPTRGANQSSPDPGPMWKSLGRVKLVVIHYHLRPGGVRRVIERALPDLIRALRPDRVVIATGEHPGDDFPVAGTAVQLVPGLGYVSEQQGAGPKLHRQIREGLGRILTAGEPTVVWAHNLSLGRNLPLARELAALCHERRIPLLAHQHDWWFDNRWQRWPEMRRSGFRTLRSVADTLFPDNVVHLTINQADCRLLETHFPGRVHWLPNSMEPDPPPSPTRLRSARRWLRDRLGNEKPLWLLPCRLLRRKNIAEALLLTRWLRPEACLVVAGSASSADEQAYAARLEAAARKQGWSVRFGLLDPRDPTAPAMAELMALSEAILLTSLLEGFGLPNLEAAAARRPLISRRLPNVTPDLAALGFRFPQSYDEILVAPGLFDRAAEIRRQKTLFRTWQQRLPGACRRWAPQPELPGDSPIPFSRLTLTAQLELLAHPVADSWSRCLPLNPFLAEWKQRAATASLQVSPWPRKAAKWLEGQAYAARFAKLARIPAHPTAAGPLAAQEDFIRARLTDTFPLLWATDT